MECYVPHKPDAVILGNSTMSISESTMAIFRIGLILLYVAAWAAIFVWGVANLLLVGTGILQSCGMPPTSKLASEILPIGGMWLAGGLGVWFGWRTRCAHTFHQYCVWGGLVLMTITTLALAQVKGLPAPGGFGNIGHAMLIGFAWCWLAAAAALLLAGVIGWNLKWIRGPQ